MKKIEYPPASAFLFDTVDRLISTSGLASLIVGDNELIRSINQDYAYWDKVKYKVPESLQTTLSSEELWHIVKFNRHRGRHVLLIADESFVFTSTDSLYKQLHEFDLHLGGLLGGQDTISEADKHRYLIGSIMEESIASSQIEGTVTSRVVAKDMLRKQRPPRNHSERMIANNYTTIQHIVANKQRSLTAESLLELHRLMTADTMDKPEDCGAFRQYDAIHVVDAVDGEVIHTPPAYETLPAFVTDLCCFFNDETPT